MLSANPLCYRQYLSPSVSTRSVGSRQISDATLYHYQVHGKSDLLNLSLLNFVVAVVVLLGSSGI